MKTKKTRDGRTIAVKLTKQQEAWIDKKKQTPYGKLAYAAFLSFLIDEAMRNDP